jgi:hypothetical protein
LFVDVVYVVIPARTPSQCEKQSTSSVTGICGSSRHPYVGFSTRLACSSIIGFGAVDITEILPRRQISTAIIAATPTTPTRAPTTAAMGTPLAAPLFPPTTLLVGRTLAVVTTDEVVVATEDTVVRWKAGAGALVVGVGGGVVMAIDGKAVGVSLIIRGDGSCVGTDVGVKGAPVGEVDGIPVGAGVGAAMGPVVGADVGAAIGPPLGAAVGAVVGVEVG